jgi:tetratricopeptide (TPR) repeat protein
MACCNRARVYYEKRDFKAAIKDYSEAIRLQPNNADAFLGGFRIWDEDGKHKRVTVAPTST